MKILIIRFSSLGDIVLTQPVVKRILDVYPEARLFYLTKDQYFDVLRCFGLNMQIINFPQYLKISSEESNDKFDVVFDLHVKLNSFLARSLTVKAHVFNYNKQRKLRNAIIKHKTDKSIDSTLYSYQTALEKAAKRFNNFNHMNVLEYPQLFADKNDHIVENLNNLKSLGKKMIALFPGATHYNKQYPLDSFVKLIREVNNKYHFLLLGSFSERNLTHFLNSEVKDRTTDFGGRFSLSEILSIISMVDIVISNDSGPMHMAAALNKKQIAIFGATHPKLGFRPLNDKSIVLVANMKCQPCSLHGGKKCPLDHFECMKKIDYHQIIDSIKLLS